MNEKRTVQSFAMIGLITAMEIVLSRYLSIQTWNLKIGFSFVPIVVAAMLFGGVWAGVAGAVSDIIGTVLFPVGTYFPGFTVTAFFNGVVYALFLRKKVSLTRIVCAVMVVQLIGSQFFNTLWISMLYSSPFWPLFVTRIYQTVVMSVVQIVLIYVLNKKLIPVIKKVV